jgi:hypothetical protein
MGGLRMTETAIGGENPYVGPVAFTSSDLDQTHFFGRGRETEEVLAFVYSQPQVCVYAASGAGKTSLVNAAVVPALQAGGFDVLPPARVRGHILDEDSHLIGCRYMYEAIQSMSTESDARPGPEVTLRDFLRSRRRTASGPRVLIFDQFEELLTIYSERSFEEQEAFFVELAQAQDDDRLLRTVVLVREDHLPQVEPLASNLPKGLGVRFRIERLTRAAALEAVVRPAEVAGRCYDEAAAELLVDRLRTAKAELRPGRFESIPHRHVEPMQLQVVCEALWRRADGDRITLDMVEQFGDVTEVLGRHYDQVVGQVSQAFQVAEGDLRGWFEDSLITPMRTRGTAFRGDDTAGMANDVVDALEDRHLVRAERRAAGRWYELVHDTFVESILDSNRHWFLEHRNRQKRLVRLTIAVLCIALVALLFANTTPEQRPRDANPASLLAISDLEVDEDAPLVREVDVETEGYLTVEAQRAAPSARVQDSDGLTAVLRDPDGEELPLRDEDPGWGITSSVHIDEPGEYELTITGDDETTDINLHIDHARHRLRAPASWDGVLHDEQDAVAYTLVGTGPFLVEVRSDEFDPVLTVYTPGNELVTASDDLPVELGTDVASHDSLVVLSAVSSPNGGGTHQLVVESFSGSGSGAYELVVRRAEGTLETQGSPGSVDAPGTLEASFWEVGPGINAVDVIAGQVAVGVVVWRGGQPSPGFTLTPQGRGSLEVSPGDYLVLRAEGGATLEPSEVVAGG